MDPSPAPSSASPAPSSAAVTPPSLAGGGGGSSGGSGSPASSRRVIIGVVAAIAIMSIVATMNVGGSRSSPAPCLDSASKVQQHHGQGGIKATTCRPIGRGHRVWLRAGSVAAEATPAEVSKTAIAGLRRILDAFAHDYYAGKIGAELKQPDVSSPYFTALGRGDVVVTDPCGRDVPSGADPLDIVFTHVDGAVPGWEASAKKHFEEWERRKYDQYGRFRDNGEMRYALRSVLRHGAHIIRRVFFVVEDARHMERALDNVTLQMARDAGVELVTVPHAKVFPNASVLPVFNSNAIEANLHRVPGLAPLMLYFNDDVFAGRRLSWFDLVRPSLIELPEGWRPPTDQSTLVPLPWTDASRLAVSVRTTTPTKASRDGKKRLDVWVEGELLPVMEAKLSIDSFKFNETSSLATDPTTISPEVAQTCGARAFVYSEVEKEYVQRGVMPFHMAMLHRHNRAHAWNYFGIYANYDDPHKAHFADRALFSLVLDGDPEAGVDRLLPKWLVDVSRGARFRRNTDLRSCMLASWLTIAENRRRQKHILAQHGYEAALKDVLHCVDCRPGVARPPSKCVEGWSEVVDRALPALVPKQDTAPSDFPARDIAIQKLVSRVYQIKNSPEFLFDGVSDTEQIRAMAQKLMYPPRLWVTVNDHFPSKLEGTLPTELTDEFDKLLRVAAREPGFDKN